MQENKLKNINKIIDAEAYSGGILDRAQEAAVTKDDQIVKNVIVASRHKRKSHKSQRR